MSVFVEFFVIIMYLLNYNEIFSYTINAEKNEPAHCNASVSIINSNIQPLTTITSTVN